MLLALLPLLMPRSHLFVLLAMPPFLFVRWGGAHRSLLSLSLENSSLLERGWGATFIEPF